MRFILIGAGSIGRRHMQNLLTLGHEVAAIADANPQRLEELRAARPGAVCTTDAGKALAERADAVLICSPPNFHVPQARQAIQRGLHVFIEKPLAESLADTETLAAEAAAAKRVAFVACNLRFHPSLLQVKKLLDEGRIGRPLSVRAQVGYYLPFWRPRTDYRRGYGASKAMGGGVILDCIHEFDYLRWLLGEVTEVFCIAEKKTSLEIDVEDNADILLRFQSGTVANLHLDYIQRTYRRSCEFIGEEGVLVWDYIAQSIHLYGKEDRQLQVFPRNINSDLNQMFVDEMKHFVNCVQGREQPALDVHGARVVLDIALAAKVSSEQKKVISLHR
jgi:predicted dehydrogenase